MQNNASKITRNKRKSKSAKLIDTTELSHVVIFVGGDLTNHANPMHKMTKIKLTQDWDHSSTRESKPAKGVKHGHVGKRPISNK